MRQEDFRTRLAQVIEAVFGGNVNRAAAELDFSQPTLHKILQGKTKESKDSTLQVLADRLGVSANWLRGESDRPNETQEFPEVFRGLDLLALYYERKQRKAREWLSKITPRTELGRVLKEALEAELNWEESDRVWALCLELGVSTGYFRRELLNVMRMRFEYESARLELAVAELRRLG